MFDEIESNQRKLRAEASRLRISPFECGGGYWITLPGFDNTATGPFPEIYGAMQRANSIDDLAAELISQRLLRPNGS